jgi:hypothetical protein
MNISQESLDLLKAAQAKPDDIIKSFVQPSTATTGLQAYNLEAPSKKLYPILTPLRNTIPRVGGSYAIQANWKTITNINVANVRAGVSEGKRGGVINYTLNEVFAAFRGFGMENSVTFEANYASKNFEDVKALAVQQTLESTMVQEERLILGGNTSVSLGTTPTPTLTGGTSGGSLADGTWSVICVALGLQAYLDTVGVNNGSIGQYFNAATATVPGSITRTNADGTTDTFGGGAARKSSNATVVLSGGGDSTITASVAPVAGAVGYAWFVGAAAAEKLVAVTNINSVVITADADSGAQAAADLPASDTSTSTLDFDGLLYQAWKSGSGAYIKTMATGTAGTGTTLTSDGAGGISEFEEAFVNFYNKYRLSPDVMYVSSQEMINITKKIVANGGAPLLRLTMAADNQGSIQAGVVVGQYLNKVTGTQVQVRVHPNLPAGTIFFYTNKLPYPMSNVSNVAQMLMRQDYYQLEWPLKTRKYEYGVYADGVLQHYAPFSMGIITNIANG